MPTMLRSHTQFRAFSLIELVIVVVITSIVVAVTIPRISQLLESRPDAAAQADLARLQSAIEIYSTEYGRHPDGPEIAHQLTQYSDANGNTSALKTATHIYGPYVRSIPPVPIGPGEGSTQIVTEPAGRGKWLYLQKTGEISIDLTGGVLNLGGGGQRF